MKKAWLIISVIGLGFSLSSCQSSESTSTSPIEQTTKTIKGIVKEVTTPLEGVSISLRGTSITTLTNSEGLFEFSFNVEGETVDSYTVNASKEGYINGLYTVSNDDFIEDVAQIEIFLSSEMINITGKVIDKDNNPLQGASVQYLTNETFTDENGMYSLTIDRPLENLSITVSKEYYETTTINIEDFASSNVVANATLYENVFNVSGIVKTYSLGGINGATVEIYQSLDNDNLIASATTNENGSFAFENVTHINLPYVLKVTKEGYNSKTIAVTENNANIDIELDLPVQQLSGTIFPTYTTNSTGYVTRNSTGLSFMFDVGKLFEYELGKEEAIQLFISTGETSSSRDGNTVVEFKMTSNDDIISVWDYSSGAPTMVTNIEWGNEVVYSTIKDIENNRTYAYLDIKYSTFAKCGENYANINKDSTIGISLGMWSDFNPSNPWTGWDVGNDMKAYNGSTFIDPICPFNYIRFNKEGMLYQSPSNEYVKPGTYIVTGKVSDEEGIAIANALVSIENTTCYDTTDENGNYVIELKDQFFAVTPNIKVTCDGYNELSQSHSRDEFVENTITANIQLERAISPSIVTSPWGSENWTSKLERIDDSFVFTCTTTGEFATPETGENVCSIWLAFGEETLSSDTRNGKNVIEIKYLSTRAWAGVYSHKTNAFIGWNNGIGFSWSADNKTIVFTLPLAYVINEAGFSGVTMQDRIGVTFSQWNANNENPYVGWVTETGWYANPDNPQTYGRWNSDNTLTWGN